MILGSAIASTFGLVYAFTFPQILYNNSLFSLAATVSNIGRIVDTIGFALAIFGIVRAFPLARSQPLWPPSPGLNAPAATAGMVPVAPPLRHPAARIVLLGLAVFIVGLSFSLAGQLVPLVLSGLEGIRAENVALAISSVTSAAGTFLILYGIAAFLVRDT